jgi:hypothetical protein
MTDLTIEVIEPVLQGFHSRIQEELGKSVDAGDLMDALKHLMRAQFYASQLRTYVQSCLTRIALEKGVSAAPSVLVSLNRAETMLSSQISYCKGIYDDISNCCYLSNKLNYDTIFG